MNVSLEEESASGRLKNKLNLEQGILSWPTKNKKNLVSYLRGREVSY